LAIHLFRDTFKKRGPLFLLVLGFALGIISSYVAAILYDRLTQPKLVVFAGAGRDQGGGVGGEPLHEFYHLIVRNESAHWPVSGRKPAWDCAASIEVVDKRGQRVLPEAINGRWASQPQPIMPVSTSAPGTGAIDFGRLVLARKINVHSHDDQSLSVALKYEGSPDCYLFSNESYLFDGWQNPSWNLGPGSHRLRITLHYERPAKPLYFWLHNTGLGRGDLRLEAEQ